MIQHREIQTVSAGNVPQLAARSVTFTHPFHLNHVGPKPRQKLRAGGPRLHMREVENSITCEGLTHVKVRVTKNSATDPNPLYLDRPFTWIFTAKCSENTLKRWGAVEDPEFGAHVYRLAPGLSMGIVDLDSLPYNADTILLKMLGQAESAKLAFADILKLDPKLELRNDIIEVSIKHCIYLEQVKVKLTDEELEFMTYVKTEEAYQEWVRERRAEGKIEGIREGIIKSATNMVRAKFGADALTPDVSDRLEQLNEQQVDDFTAKIFSWQHSTEMADWLENQ